MGNSHIKKRISYASDQQVEGLKNKVKILQWEINEIMCMRENEGQACERDMMVFAVKQAEWTKERRRLKVEAKNLRMKLKKTQQRFKGINNNEKVDGTNDNNQLQLLSSSFLLKRIMDKQARRDEAMERWKKLYFAVKVEIDDLVERTNQGGRLWKLQKQLQAKEETIELLQARLATMKQQEFQREREIDILRQSLRIMSHKRKASKVSKSPSANLMSCPSIFLAQTHIEDELQT